ncbi:MAG: MoaD/ThiS family protein [Solirubrobacterales bacterium]|nr:MoaD/ThiS family protein [Solirubrobacterales bacterium]MCB0862072.1 MoaD/ThiS family protein [Solirubrobacterales bacterium]MCB8916068.1 MoaD/ThiS family protein [Thermoleophilales bacterium]
MSRVSVRLFAGAAEAFGGTEAELDGVATLADLSDALAGDDARLREVLDQCSFFVDGEHQRELDTALPDSCKVDVLPPFAGG